MHPLLPTPAFSTAPAHAAAGTRVRSITLSITAASRALVLAAQPRAEEHPPLTQRCTTGGPQAALTLSGQRGHSWFLGWWGWREDRHRAQLGTALARRGGSGSQGTAGDLLL